jgi:sigma-B regulation protein RsbU (phosphoserine phosphatase)
MDQRDLATAGRLQRMLLPPTDVSMSGWRAAHVFEPAGIVSGDYIDLVPYGGGLFFMVGDVSGKGVAAALLMAQLHAMFRTLVSFGLPLEELMARASGLLCASSLPAQYATLVSGYLHPSGIIDLVNAGHPSPLLVRSDGHSSIRATGVPMGLFCESRFASTTLALDDGETLVIYTDGLSEARNHSDEEYGLSRIESSVAAHAASGTLRGLVDGCVADQARFRGSSVNGDDLTVLALRRETGAPAASIPAELAGVCATRHLKAS